MLRRKNSHPHSRLLCCCCQQSHLQHTWSSHPHVCAAPGSAAIQESLQHEALWQSQEEQRLVLILPVIPLPGQKATLLTVRCHLHPIKHPSVSWINSASCISTRNLHPRSAYLFLNGRTGLCPDSKTFRMLAVLSVELAGKMDSFFTTIKLRVFGDCKGTASQRSKGFSG